MDEIELKFPTPESMETPGMPVTRLQESDVSVVDVGSGNNEWERWSIVAVAMWSDGVSKIAYSYLTNFFSEAMPTGGLYEGGVWIDVTSTWSNVAWTGERLAKGENAQRVALSCLGATNYI